MKFHFLNIDVAPFTLLSGVLSCSAAVEWNFEMMLQKNWNGIYFNTFLNDQGIWAILMTIDIDL